MLTAQIKSTLEQASAELQNAKKSLEQAQYDAAGVQASAAGLHTARALLLDEGIEPDRHGDIITPIQKHFVAGRKLTVEQGEKLSWLSQLGKRDNSSDSPLLPGEAQKAVEFAGSFFAAAMVILES